MLTQESLEEFKELWFIQYGRKIDDKSAQIIGTKLLKFIRAIYQPIPKNKSKVIRK